MPDDFSNLRRKTKLSFFQLRKIPSFFRTFLIGSLILSALLAVYCGIYMTRNLLPLEDMKQQVNLAAEKGFISSEVTGRAPAGWGVDHATECLTFGLGLGKGELGEQLSDKFISSKTTFNPCVGLIQSSTDVTTETYTESYARYWHGHAVLSQWLIYFLGLPIFRNLLSVIALLFLILNFSAIEKIRNENNSLPKLYSFLLLGPFLILGDWADVYASIPHILANIGCMGITLIFSRSLDNSKNQNLFYSGLILGSVYNFILFMLSPQSIPIMLLTWVLLPRIMSGRNIRTESVKFSVFFAGILFGYIATWIGKWILVAQLTDIDIFGNVIGQAVHRTSTNISSLSSGVSLNLDFISGAPVFVQSIFANITALGIHIADPRYSSEYYFAILGLIFLLFIFQFFRSFIQLSESQRKLNYLYFGALAFSTFVLLTWYSILGQHSFDHATFTYRSLAILLGGYMCVLGSVISNKPSDN